MRKQWFVAALACASPLVSAGTLQVDATTVPGVSILWIANTDTREEVSSLLESLLDDERRVVMAGPPEALQRIRPRFVTSWPVVNTIILDPQGGLGVFGFDAPDDELRLSAVAGWPWGDYPTARGRRTSLPENGLHQIDFSVASSSPWQTCRTFGANLFQALFGDAAPGTDEVRAFRREMRRWCQYGTLSAYSGARPGFVVPNYRSSNIPRLTVLTEWALVRSEDPANRTRVKYYFWVKTMGEGAGSGFTRASGATGWLQPETNELRDLMDVAIHSGWGELDRPEVVTAWPANSSFPQTGDVFLFRCDAPEAIRPLDCPVGPRLRKLFPADSFDGKVTLSMGEQFSVGGEAKVGGRGGPKNVNVSLGLHVVRLSTNTSQVDFAMTQTRSNADATYYRSTWWTPDLRAIYRWLDVRGRPSSLAGVTPLTSTLNPHYEILWELPLDGNAGRQVPYHIVYEVGLNTCNESYTCTGPGSAQGDRAKARVGWKDTVMLRIPSS
jgi:hypothetical protein